MAHSSRTLHSVSAPSRVVRSTIRIAVTIALSFASASTAQPRLVSKWLFGTKRGGKVVIEFGSPDDLERIVSEIVGSGPGLAPD